jgi:hypothetical protein
VGKLGDNRTAFMSDVQNIESEKESRANHQIIKDPRWNSRPPRRPNEMDSPRQRLPYQVPVDVEEVSEEAGAMNEPIHDARNA